MHYWSRNTVRLKTKTFWTLNIIRSACFLYFLTTDTIHFTFWVFNSFRDNSKHHFLKCCLLCLLALAHFLSILKSSLYFFNRWNRISVKKNASLAIVRFFIKNFNYFFIREPILVRCSIKEHAVNTRDNLYTQYSGKYCFLYSCRHITKPGYYARFAVSWNQVIRCKYYQSIIAFLPWRIGDFKQNFIKFSTKL